MTKALLQQALSAMKYHTEQTRPIERTYEAMDALKAAIAQPVQPAPQQAAGEWPTCKACGGNLWKCMACHPAAPQEKTK